jgi:hypothetical protein
MGKLSCQLSLYPDYLCEKMNLDFSKHYHTDPNPKDIYSATTLA